MVLRCKRVLKPTPWQSDDERMTRPLLAINGVGPATAKVLTAAGFSSAESVAAAQVDALTIVSGIGPVRAEVLQAAAQGLVAGPAQEPEAVATADDSAGDKPSKSSRKKAKKLVAKAEELRTQAKRLDKKAKTTKSKKKRKKRVLEVADIEAAAKKLRKKAKKLLAR